jgi:hypothetical protein
MPDAIGAAFGLDPQCLQDLILSSLVIFSTVEPLPDRAWL